MDETELMQSAKACNEYKICLSGKSGVGKTSIFARLMKQGFTKEKPKIGTDVFKYTVAADADGYDKIREIPHRSKDVNDHVV